MHKRDVKIRAGVKLLVVSDLHVPYHCTAAINKAITAGKDAGCTGVIILGDLVDFHKVSKYRHDANAHDLKEELQQARYWLRVFRNQFSNLWYVPGNHEDRLSKYIEDNAPSLGVLDELKLDKLLKLDEYQCRYVPGGYIHCGDMTFLHGHEVRISGLDPARKLFARMKKSAICGHLHRPDSFFTRDGAGNLLQCHVLGHLGKASPAYMPRNDWQHGCAVVHVPKSGKAQVQTHIFR